MEDQSRFDANRSYQPPKEKKQHFAKINHWLKHHPRKSWAILIATLLLISGGLIFALGGGSFNGIVTPAKSSAKARYYSKLTGVEVSKKQADRPVTAVMIENSPDARPQSGLKEANVVFEAVAEAGITRFLVLYQEGQPKLIGPVRSVRPHFASLAAPFDAGVAHVGGSKIPLQKLRSGQIKDLDQFFNDTFYWRATDRYAPHNVYTTMAKLDALNKSKHYNSSNFTPWAHSLTAVASTKPTATSITIPISTGEYLVNYKWDKKQNDYLRFEGGEAHKDREKGQITPKVVIAMQVKPDVIHESNHWDYPNVNTHGTAWLFQNGTVKKISWNKKNDKSMISFVDESGKAISLDPGQAWITLISPDVKPTWK